MTPTHEAKPEAAPQPNAFAQSDVLLLLEENGWLARPSLDEQIAAPASPELHVWCSRAAALLGPHCADRSQLRDLLGLIFEYDARAILSRVETHMVLSRSAAREVLRRLALLLLDGVPITSDRFQEIVQALKSELDARGRELFHPLRLALAGRAGEGELDRVILLLDEAADLPFAAHVKSTRERIVEFCAALD